MGEQAGVKELKEAMGQQWDETRVLKIAGRFGKRLQGLDTQLRLKKPTMPIGSESEYLAKKRIFFLLLLPWVWGSQSVPKLHLMI